ncbi:MAG TPA: SgcJ/EcaC family oxidoreductase [Ktedonobacteraceae bacterium]
MVDTNILQAEEAEIRAVMRRLNEAWGDADIFAAVFTEDAEYITFDGSMVKGREAIAESHRPLFEGFMRGSRLAGEPPTIRFLTPDVALVHGKGAVIQKRQKKAARRAISTQTNVLVKQDGRWQIAAFHNTRYRPWNAGMVGKFLTFLNERSLARARKQRS